MRGSSVYLSEPVLLLRSSISKPVAQQVCTTFREPALRTKTGLHISITAL